MLYSEHQGTWDLEHMEKGLKNELKKEWEEKQEKQIH